MCKSSYFEEVITQEVFYEVVESAVNVRSGGAVGSAASFCGSASTLGASVGVPAALSVVYTNADGTSPMRATCSFPTSAAAANCDTELPLDSFRRFCPCVDYNCDGAWFLGFTGESCDATCDHVGGVCQADPLSDIVDADSFQSMLTSTTELETNQVIGNAAAASFCSDGINLFNFATAPAAVSLSHGAFNQTLCTYPTSPEQLHGGCAQTFLAPPAQRFCNCRTVSARRKLSVGVVEAVAVSEGPAQVATVQGRLRGTRV